MPLDLTLCTHSTSGKFAKSLDKAFRQRFATMTSQGFIVKVVAFDSESAVATVSDTIRELGAQCEQKPHESTSNDRLKSELVASFIRSGSRCQST